MNLPKSPNLKYYFIKNSPNVNKKRKENGVQI